MFIFTTTTSVSASLSVEAADLRPWPFPHMTAQDRNGGIMQVNESALRQLLHVLPPPNVAILKRLLAFLRKVASYSSKNHMVAESLATFFGTWQWERH